MYVIAHLVIAMYLYCCQFFVASCNGALSACLVNAESCTVVQLLYIKAMYSYSFCITATKSLTNCRPDENEK